MSLSPQDIATQSLSEFIWRMVREGRVALAFPPTPAEQAIVDHELTEVFPAWCAKREAALGRVLVGSAGWTSRCRPLPALRRTAR